MLSSMSVLALQTIEYKKHVLVVATTTVQVTTVWSSFFSPLLPLSVARCTPELVCGAGLKKLGRSAGTGLG